MWMNNIASSAELIKRCKRHYDQLLQSMIVAIESKSTSNLAIDERRLIFVATMKKVSRSSQAIDVLFSGDFYEDLNVLARTLMESVITAAYIQYASDAEVSAYKGFDIIPINKMITYVKSVAPEAWNNRFSNGAMEMFDQYVESVKQETGKSDKDYGWTRFDVVSRALKVDNESGLSGFILLAKAMFPLGHPFVHGNYRSLIRYVADDLTSSAKMIQIEQVLYNTTLALLAFTAFANRAFNLDMDSEVAAVESDLRRIGDGWKSSFV